MSLPRISNALTRLLDIQVPVVCAPMATVSNAKLVSNVTLGGGHGFLAAGYASGQALRSDLAAIRSTLDTAGHHRNPSTLPVGVGYFGWKLEQDHETARDLLNAALENGVRSIWLSFGPTIGKWVDYVRQNDRQADRKTTVFVLVNSVEEALRAANEWKADVLVAQGIESGGHGGSYAPPVFSLVTSILDTIPETRPLVLAAGGFSNGAQVASFLTLGASGVVFGTRFLLTPESPYSDAQKAALVAAKATSTVRSMAFDEARKTLSWPQDVDGRGLSNELVQDFDTGVDINIIRERFAQRGKTGATDYAITWAGTGVGEMHEVKGAKDVVHELHQQIVERLQATQALLGDQQDR